MKRILCTGFLILSALVMAGCEDIPGVLSVTKNFKVLVKGKNKDVTTGEHKTSLDFKKNRVVATIESSDGDLKVELAVPKDSQIPSNGNFELRSGQSGQPFDILGSAHTKVTEGATQSGFETCQKQDYETICDPKGCHVAPIFRQGTRSIQFYNRETSQTMQFDMTGVSNAQDKYGHFFGSARYSEKIVVSEGPCF